MASNKHGGRTPPPEEDLKNSLHEKFGFGFERISDVGETIKTHDDRTALHWLGSSIFWFIVATTFGMIAAVELFAPEVFRGIPWLVFSRVRPSHVNAVIFAWLTTMYFGAGFYFLPRLLGTRKLWSESLGIWTAWIYNVTLALGFITLLAGFNQGREYAEFIWPIDILVMIVFTSNTINILSTVAIRKVKPLYVSVWWVIAAPIWMAFTFAIDNVIWRPGNIFLAALPWNPSGALPAGLNDAMINWWGAHNLFGLFLTPMLIATVYYLVPRITNTPLYSHTLSLISFWGLIFIYAGVGHHHLLQSPTPGWLKTIASVSSFGILIPVFAFFINIYLTMRGNWDRFFTSLPLRYILTGFIFYVLVNLQGAIQAYQPFNVFTHFTQYVIAHAHLALLGGFTILGMGAINYMIPLIVSKPPYSAAIAEFQYWLVTSGFLLFFTALTIAGFVQGQSWMSGQPEVNVLANLKVWMEMRAIGGGMIYLSGFLMAYNMLRTAFSNSVAANARQQQKDFTSGLETGSISP